MAVTLGEALARHGIRCAQQDVHRLDEAGRSPLRPDLVLYREGRPVSVIDTKYVFLRAPAPPADHLHQLLVYAATAPDAASTDHVIRRSPVTITAHALNLCEPPAGVLAQIAALAAVTGAHGQARRPAG